MILFWKLRLTPRWFKPWLFWCPIVGGHFSPSQTGHLTITKTGHKELPGRLVVSNIFYVHPEPWGNDPIWRAYFSKWVGSTTNQHVQLPAKEIWVDWACFSQFAQFGWLGEMQPKIYLSSGSVKMGRGFFRNIQEANTYTYIYGIYNIYVICMYVYIPLYVYIYIYLHVGWFVWNIYYNGKRCFFPWNPMGPRLLFFLRRQGSWTNNSWHLKGQVKWGTTKKRFRRLRKESNAVAKLGNFYVSPKMGRWSHFDYIYLFFSDGWLIEPPTVVWFCSCQSEVWRMHQDEQEEQVGHKPSAPPQKKKSSRHEMFY